MFATQRDAGTIEAPGIERIADRSRSNVVSERVMEKLRSRSLLRRLRKAVDEDGLTYRQAALRLGIDGTEMLRLLVER